MEVQIFLNRGLGCRRAGELPGRELSSALMLPNDGITMPHALEGILVSADQVMSGVFMVSSVAGCDINESERWWWQGLCGV